MTNITSSCLSLSRLFCFEGEQFVVVVQTSFIPDEYCVEFVDDTSDIELYRESL